MAPTNGDGAADPGTAERHSGLVSSSAAVRDGSGGGSRSSALGTPVSPRGVASGGVNGVSSTKAVSIIEPEGISPMMLAGSKDLDDDFSLDRTAPKQRRAKVASKLKGRHADDVIASRSPRLVAQSPGLLGLAQTTSRGSEAGDGTKGRLAGLERELHAQIRQWLGAERSRKLAEKIKGRRKGEAFKPSDILGTKAEPQVEKSVNEVRGNRSRRGSDVSEGTAALDKLEQILDKAMLLDGRDSPQSRRGSRILGRKGSIRRLRRGSTTGSDTDYFDGAPAVPYCDMVLDNSKTLAYSGGASDGKLSPNLSRRNKEVEAWTAFKYEIVRLAHTLRLKGWKRVPMQRSRELTVERLSGALTNAVYVVEPPKDVPCFTPQTRPSDTDMEDDESGRKRKPPPMKLLLRIYGPQVSHLIDRDSELAVLRRLALKNIGPKLLGTFTNGRFEEFLNAKALKPEDLRNKETSRQIAKRFRELHDGIELLPEERNAGPFVWRNWDKWVDRCERVVQHVDAEVLDARRGSVSSRRGSKVGGELVCGTTWAFFRAAVERYRTWLEQHYGGPDGLAQQLVFAHNDAQYGNILRLEPPGDSPLLLPANSHKQLVVIDFEYSNANMRGLEFANHFTEWTYNYHDEATSYACNTALYPTLEEQRRFVQAYVRHRPKYRASGTPSVGTPYAAPSDSAGATPRLSHKTSTSSLPAFFLDARTPAGAADGSSAPDREATDAAEEEEQRATEAEVQRLLRETKLWRLANSAQWVAWGIVQAKVAGLPPSEEAATQPVDSPEGKVVKRADDPLVAPLVASPDEAGSDALDAEGSAMQQDFEDKRPDSMARPEEAEEDSDEFDYLAYAHERALFFWGDAVQVGLVREEELPAGLVGRLKRVEY